MKGLNRFGDYNTQQIEKICGEKKCYNLCNKSAGLAQLAEYPAHNRTVLGSIP